MANKNVTLKDTNNNSLFPKTFAYNVFTEDNESIDNVLDSKLEYTEDTTGSQDPSPFADYYNKSQTDALLNQRANTSLTNVTLARTSSSLTINGIAGTKYSGYHICIESWVSSDKTSGYRIYNDGYCEQWGRELTKSATTFTIQLFKSMGNSNYTVLTSYVNETTDVDLSNGAICVGNKTTQNFRLKKWSADSVNWKVCGYIN